MKKVLIPTQLERIAREVLEKHGGYVVVQETKTDLAVLAKQHPDTYALIVRSEPLGAAEISAFPQLAVIVRAGSGYNTIDVQFARERGIDVMNTPGANANAVAELVLALALADARHVIAADTSTRAGRWEKKAFMGRELTGKTVGIVGLGNIGQLVARRLGGFETTLLGYDPVVSQQRAESLEVELVGLTELFERSDYVTLHVPENAETKGMVNATMLERMKPGAVLINCARAGVLDEAALRRIKSERGIRFLNDVYPKDAAGPKSVADVADIMLPHLGANTYEANIQAARRAAEQLIALDDKGIATFIVNRDVPEGLDEAYGRLAYTITRLGRHLLGPAAKLNTIETSFYGSLAPFADWLMASVVRALNDSFERRPDPQEARRFLAEAGVEAINRPTDPKKGYGASLTIDLIGSLDAGTLHRVSIRGTVTEGVMMISRINEFDKLYFEPRGPTVLFIYKDRPGVLGEIGAALGAGGINIEDMRNPHHAAADRSLAMMRVNRMVPEALVAEIAGKIKALSSFFYDFGV